MHVINVMLTTTGENAGPTRYIKNEFQAMYGERILTRSLFRPATSTTLVLLS